MAFLVVVEVAAEAEEKERKRWHKTKDDGG